jgi:hypothetical protein
VSLDTRFGKRRTVNMSEDIAQELNRLANSQGKTLYSLINEIGLSALQASRNGFTLLDAITAKRATERAKKSRMVVVNQDLWYFACSEAMKTSKDKWIKQISAVAQWTANVFLDGLSDGEFLKSVKAFLNDFFWDCSEINLEEVGGDSLRMKLAFVPEMPLEHTKVLFKSLEIMFNSYGYLPTRSEVGPGFMSVTFKNVGRTLAIKPQQ